MTGSISAGERTPPLLEGTIGANLEATSARFGDREALVDVPTGRRWTYAELNADVDRLALSLDAAGLRKGDRLGIWAPNCAEWTLVQYATAKLGAILVNINPAYRTHELELRAAPVGLPACSWPHRRSRPATTRAMIDEVARRPSGRWSTASSSARPTGTTARPAPRRRRRRAGGPRATLDADDPINIQYTSGTTGFPKGATLSHHNILNNGYFVGEVLRLHRAGPGLHPGALLPLLRHGDGQPRLRPSHGSTMVIPAPAFDPDATLQAVQAGALHLAVRRADDVHRRARPPGLRELRPPSLRTGIMAGSPCPVEVMRRVVAEMHMAEVTICYGMTETSPVCTQTARRRRARAAGLDRRPRPSPRRGQGRRPGARGDTVPRGDPGELCTRGYSVMLGYWDEPERTAEAHRSRGLDAHRRPGARWTTTAT